MAGTSGAARARVLARLLEEANHRCHALGGRHEQIARERYPQRALRVERGEEHRLRSERQVAVSRREARPAEEPAPRGQRNDACLGGIRRTLDKRGTRSIEHDLGNTVGKREAPQLRVNTRTRRHRKHAHGHGAVEVLRD